MHGPGYRRWLYVVTDADRVLWLRSTWEPVRDQVIALRDKWKGQERVVVHLLNQERTGPTRQKSFSVDADSWTVGEDVAASLRTASVQLEAPSLKYCEARGTWPALFIHGVKPFNKYMQMAMHIVFSDEIDWEGRDAVLRERVADVVKPAMVARSQSGWDRLPESKTLDRFLAVGFNYRGSHEDRFPDLEKVEGAWERL
jgi:hypothetical protein